MNKVDSVVIQNTLNMLKSEFDILCDEYKIEDLDKDLNYDYIDDLTNLIHKNLNLLRDITIIIKNHT